MKGIPARVAANVVWVVLFSIAAVLGAFFTFASGVIFDDSYLVRVPMPEAGGVLPDQEVTVLGRAVGVVEDIDVTAEGVEITLKIDGGQSVPTDSTVQVLRRSPIGEQAVDFQPEGADWTPAEQGAVIEPAEAVVPAEVPVLLKGTEELFEAVDPADVGSVFAEAADALEGRGSTLKQLNRDALALNRTLTDGIPEFDRVIDSSEAVLDELADHRFALAESFGNAADLAEIFDEQSPTISRLLDTGMRATVEADALIRNERANLECLLIDVNAFNDMALGPSTFPGRRDLYDSKLDEISAGLERHRFFFHRGINIVAQPDPTTGATWQRILFEDPASPGDPQPYDEPRPTPPTEPGAACQSEAFGLGVNAVRQDDPQPPHSTSPGIDYAPLASGEQTRVEPGSDGGDSQAHPDGSAGRAGSDDGGDGGATTAMPAADLPTTGGGALLLAPAALGMALWLRRRP